MYRRASVNRIVIISTVALVTLAVASVGALAWADGRSQEQLPAGAQINGVDLGGLSRGAALRKARKLVAGPIQRPVVVQLGERRYTITAAQAGVRIDLDGAIAKAYAAGRDGSFLSRGWRKLTGTKIDTHVTVPVTLDHRAVRSFVESIGREQSKVAVDAALTMTLTKVSVTAAKPGRRLAAKDALVARIERRLATDNPRRTLRAKTLPVSAKVTEDAVFDANPLALTVSREGKIVRVFKRGKLVKTYTVAVGSPTYPTPTGRFVVQTMQVNPPWNVPNSEWAGNLAGESIPGGDPRNPLVARWIGFNGSVGFHGTASTGSLGSAASHGCVRMAPSDVIDLYKRVKIGTPVLVA
jgi:lipoprotein-anchoring transpeptidase ErfK/SrfK